MRGRLGVLGLGIMVVRLPALLFSWFDEGSSIHSKNGTAKPGRMILGRVLRLCLSWRCFLVFNKRQLCSLVVGLAGAILLAVVRDLGSATCDPIQLVLIICLGHRKVR